MSKIIGLSGSPRKAGATETLVKTALKAVNKNGIETEFISLAGKNIQPCQGCYSCRKPAADGRCVINDDLQPIFEKLIDADGIIIGSPVYFLSVTAQLKALFDRGLVLRYGKSKIARSSGIRKKPDFLLNNKVGAAISVGGSNGQQLTLLEILKWMVFQNMIVVGNNQDLGANASAGGFKNIYENKDAITQAYNTGLKVAEIVEKLKN